MDLLQFPSEVVTKFGVHNIEPLAQHFLSTQPPMCGRVSTTPLPPFANKRLKSRKSGWT
jgi:hypothetical protein